MEKLYTGNDENVKTFMKEKLTVKVFPTRDEMGTEAALNVASTINELLQSKDEINKILCNS